MFKWVLFGGFIITAIFVVAFIKFMLKTEKDSKTAEIKDSDNKSEEYVSQDAPINIHSASAGIPPTDMSNNVSKSTDTYRDMIDDVPDLPMPEFNGFIDDLDNDFSDYSQFAHNSKGRRRKPVDFDLDGDLADEYIPSSPDFNYLPKRQPRKKKSISTELNELPTELKVLMLSDIFDRKFFD